MERLGQVAMPREEYLEAVHSLRDDYVNLSTDRRPVARLVP